MVLRRGTVWVMAVGCGVAAANLYFNQPMLKDIGGSVHASDKQMGLVVTLGQVGYGLGMLLFIPLGDLVDRKKLIVALLIATSVALAASAVSINYPWLALATLAVGLTTVTAQVLMPLAAHLAEPSQRGKVIGNLYTGLLLGILLARTLSGMVSAHFGWRTMFALASGGCVLLCVALAWTLPHVSQGYEEGLTYRKLIGSMARLVVSEPQLREACVIGGSLFGSFSAFWTTLVFLLSNPPYHYGSRAAGLFGLVGAASALIAPVAGKLADRRGSRFVIASAAMVVLGSWILFWLLGYSLWGLILGVVLLDLGVQAAQVSNQSRVLGLLPHARGRVNTVYMIGYFTGGSLGSLLATLAWARWGWPGVCAVGAAMTAVGGLTALHAVRQGDCPPAEASALSPTPESVHA
jgi:predicted MFS family arabinose efflux permease